MKSSSHGGKREGAGRPRKIGARPTPHLGPFLSELAEMRKELPESAEDFIRLVLRLRAELAVITARADELPGLLSSVEPPALRQAALMIATLPQRVALTQALIEAAGSIQKRTGKIFPGWGDTAAARQQQMDDELGKLLAWPHGEGRT